MITKSKTIFEFYNYQLFRVWHETCENDMKTISFFDFDRNQIIVNLSMNFKNKHHSLSNHEIVFCWYSKHVWCDIIFAILFSMHCHQYIQNDNTFIRVWHEAYENDMKTTSFSDFDRSRVIVDLSMNPEKL